MSVCVCMHMEKDIENITFKWSLKNLLFGSMRGLKDACS